MDPWNNNSLTVWSKDGGGWTLEEVLADDSPEFSIEL
jgi:hypothetical protein